MIKSFAELAQELSKIAPTKYMYFKDKPNVDYITYVDIGNNQFYADSKTIKRNTLVSVELYSKQKNEQLEKELRDMFEYNEVPYEEEETEYNEGDDLFIKEFIIELHN